MPMATEPPARCNLPIRRVWQLKTSRGQMAMGQTSSSRALRCPRTVLVVEPGQTQRSVEEPVEAEAADARAHRSDRFYEVFGTRLLGDGSHHVPHGAARTSSVIPAAY